MTRLARVLALVCALSVTGGCAGRLPPPSTTPPVSAPVHRLQETKRVLDAVKRVGNVAEQVQNAEIALFKAGKIAKDVHDSIQKSFLKTADAVITGIETLATAARTVDPAVIVKAIADGIRELIAKLDVLPASTNNLLTGWLETALVLVEILL